jgi:hypothetical protein
MTRLAAAIGEIEGLGAVTAARELEGRLIERAASLTSAAGPAGA